MGLVLRRLYRDHLRGGSSENYARGIYCSCIQWEFLDEEEDPFNRLTRYPAWKDYVATIKYDPRVCCLVEDDLKLLCCPH